GEGVLEPDLQVLPQSSHRLRTSGPDPDGADPAGSGGATVEAGEAGPHRPVARAGWSHEAKTRTGADPEVDPAQGGDSRSPSAVQSPGSEYTSDIGDLDQRRRVAGRGGHGLCLGRVRSAFGPAHAGF